MSKSLFIFAAAATAAVYFYVSTTGGTPDAAVFLAGSVAFLGAMWTTLAA